MIFSFKCGFLTNFWMKIFSIKLWHFYRWQIWGNTIFLPTQGCPTYWCTSILIIKNLKKNSKKYFKSKWTFKKKFRGVNIHKSCVWSSAIIIIKTKSINMRNNNKKEKIPDSETTSLLSMLRSIFWSMV